MSDIVHATLSFELNFYGMKKNKIWIFEFLNWKFAICDLVNLLICELFLTKHQKLPRIVEILRNFTQLFFICRDTPAKRRRTMTPRIAERTVKISFLKYVKLLQA